MSPRRVLLVPTVAIHLKHMPNVRIFDEHGVALAD